jgi:hypothetical protein
MVITWISWGAAPGYINIAPLGLFKVIFVSQKVQFVPFLSIHSTWGDEKEVSLVLKLDPIFIPLKTYYFKNNQLTIVNHSLIISQSEERKFH